MTISQVSFSPFGVGTTAPAVSAPTPGGGVRYIDPATKDYEYDSTTGQLAQMPTVRQRVLLAVMTLQGSVSVNTAKGILLPRKMGGQFDVEMKQSVRTALYQLTDVEAVLSIDDIKVEPGQGGRARVTITYTDLTTGEEDTVQA
jgi:hypothetical protein